MADEKEILRYELDVSDVEAKAERIKQLVAEITRTQAAGGNTAELEATLGREVAGLTRFADQGKRAGGVTEDLIQNKQKLAAAVSLVGGEFGGAVSQIGSVLSLLMSMGPAVAGVAGAMVLLAGGRQVWEGIAQAAQKAKEAVEGYNKAVAEREGQRLEDLKGLEATLAGTPAASAGGTAAASALAAGMGRLGYGLEEVKGVSRWAVNAPLSPEQAALLSELGTAGYTPKTTREALDMVAGKGVHPADLEGARQRVADRLTTETGKNAARLAAPYHAGTPEQAVVERLREWKEQIDVPTLRERVAEARQLREEIAEIDALVSGPVPDDPHAAELIRLSRGGERYRGREKKAARLAEIQRYEAMLRDEERLRPMNPAEPYGGMTAEEMQAEEAAYRYREQFNRRGGGAQPSFRAPDPRVIPPSIDKQTVIYNVGTVISATGSMHTPWNNPRLGLHRGFSLRDGC